VKTLMRTPVLVDLRNIYKPAPKKEPEMFAIHRLKATYLVAFKFPA